MTVDFDAERRAYELLQWVPYSLPAEFDEELAAQGHYTKLQRKRNDEAIDAWDKAHPYEPSDELAAFRELERLGVFTQSDFFSPTKAKDERHYTKLLAERRANDTGGSVQAGSSRRDGSQGRTGKGLAPSDAQQSRRAGNRTRRKRPGTRRLSGGS